MPTVLPESFCQKKRRTPKLRKNRHFTPKKRKKTDFLAKNNENSELKNTDFVHSNELWQHCV